MRAVICLIILLVASPAAAEILGFRASLDEAQATTCAIGSPAMGIGYFEFDTATKVFTYHVQYGTNAPAFSNGLLNSGATETVSHVHVGAVGVPGGVSFGLPLGSPKTGNTTLSPAQEADLLAGLFYVNIHSSDCAGGEIRGQILAATIPTLPLWATVAFAGLSALALLALGYRSVRQA